NRLEHGNLHAVPKDVVEKLDQDIERLLQIGNQTQLEKDPLEPQNLEHSSPRSCVMTKSLCPKPSSQQSRHPNPQRERDKSLQKLFRSHTARNIPRRKIGTAAERQPNHPMTERGRQQIERKYFSRQKPQKHVFRRIQAVHVIEKKCHARKCKIDRVD